MQIADLSCVNEASGDVIRQIGAEAVDVYRFIVERYRTVDPARDSIFRFAFKNGYRMENAGLTDAFKARFFELFSEAKQAGRVDIECVVKELYAFPTRKGHPSLQFSFVTKMANTVDATFPIYDKEVANFFGFSKPSNSQTFETRLKKFMDFYQSLRTTYQAILEHDLLAEPFAHFRERYGTSAAPIPDIKLIDFIIWAAAKRNLRAGPLVQLPLPRLESMKAAA